MFTVLRPNCHSLAAMAWQVDRRDQLSTRHKKWWRLWQKVCGYKVTPRHWRQLRIRSGKNLFGPPVNVTRIRIKPNELCAVQSISTDHKPNIAYDTKASFLLRIDCYKFGQEEVIGLAVVRPTAVRPTLFRLGTRRGPSLSLALLWFPIRRRRTTIEEKSSRHK